MGSTCTSNPIQRVSRITINCNSKILLKKRSMKHALCTQWCLTVNNTKICLKESSDYACTRYH